MNDTPKPDDSAQTALRALRDVLRAPPERSDARLPPTEVLARRLHVTPRALLRAQAVLEFEALIWLNKQGVAYGIHSVRRAAALGPAMSQLEARLRLEPEIAALAAMRATPGDLRLLRRLAAREVASSDSEDAELWSGALHRAVATVARNPALLAAFESIDDHRESPEWRDLAERTEWSRYEGRPLGAADHGALIEAIAAGDPEDAANAMRGHLLHMAERMEWELDAISRESALRDADADADGRGKRPGDGPGPRRAPRKPAAPKGRRRAPPFPSPPLSPSSLPPSSRDASGPSAGSDDASRRGARPRSNPGSDPGSDHDAGGGSEGDPDR
ncbi:DNA-binding transcriptional regulator, FadR family [Albimonas donghaensis]|uniref:DNA-binding transcriptional regulator, FadR family n=1 Tax=Albimonas donghaensis TaxID=356660 RepID=A0A1H3DGC4_9RHOB|nr:FCD domain-containing protein [Albimonas donghaensis]SDX65456.1 DNA-binding transcriptional regulator, FadR family [Albimonas donghaensis]